MHESDFLVQRKKQLERLLFPTQHRIEEYDRERLELQHAYDRDMTKFSMFQRYNDKEEQFHDDVLVASSAFAVGMFPKIIGDFGAVDVTFSALLGLGVCGGIVLLRNQPYLSSILSFEDLDDLAISIYDKSEKLKGISSAISSLKSQPVKVENNSSVYHHGSFHK